MSLLNKASLSASVSLAAALFLGGCYYGSASPVITHSAASCADMAGTYAAFDMAEMNRANQARQRPQPIAQLQLAQTPSGCRSTLRVVPGARPAGTPFGANVDATQLLAFMPAGAIKQGDQTVRLTAVQVSTGAAPSVNFGARAPHLYGYALRVTMPQGGEMVTIVAPDCPQSSCPATSLETVRNLASADMAAMQRTGRMPSAVAVLIKM